MPDDIAVITFDEVSDDVRAVRRSHAQLLAGGLAVVLEAALPRHAALLSTLLPSSFGTLAATIVPWALTGGRLALHHPFDPPTFVAQLAAGGVDAVAIPGLLLDAFATPEHPSAGARVIALWRAPEQQAASVAGEPLAATTDVLAFGEAGVVALARGDDGAPRAIPLGPIHHPSAAPQGASAIATDLSSRGTLTLAGPMVAPPGEPVDTGLSCRLASGGLMLDTEPAPPLGSQPQRAPAA